jgi:hypothetical protein
MMNDYEPPVKRRLVKHKIIPPDRFELCHLSASLWFELILKRLFLVELIQMKRTCKTFAKLKALKHLIKDKEYACFGDIPKLYWNRLTSYDMKKHRIVFGNNPGRFVLHFRTKNVCKQGVFSSKHLLFQELDREDLLIFDITDIYYSAQGHAMITIRNKQDSGYTYFRIKGVNDYLKTMAWSKK